MNNNLEMSCCSCPAPPSYLWFLQSNWNENELHDNDFTNGEDESKITNITTTSDALEVQVVESPSYVLSTPINSSKSKHSQRNQPPSSESEVESLTHTTTVSVMSPSMLSSDSISSMNTINSSAMSARRSSNRLKKLIEFSADWLEYKPELNLSDQESTAYLSQCHGDKRDNLIGWQIEVIDQQSKFYGVNVIADLKLNPLSTLVSSNSPYFLLVSEKYPLQRIYTNDSDNWVKLKRRSFRTSSRKEKTGLEFRLLRKVTIPFYLGLSNARF